MFDHSIGSSTELFSFSAHISPSAMQHVLGVRRGSHDPEHQPEHHRHIALMELDCCASVSNAHNEISIWIVLIKLPVALNLGSIRCKWATINFAPFLRALYIHSQCRKNCSRYGQGNLSLTVTWISDSGEVTGASLLKDIFWQSASIFPSLFLMLPFCQGCGGITAYADITFRDINIQNAFM